MGDLEDYYKKRVRDKSSNKKLSPIVKSMSNLN